MWRPQHDMGGGSALLCGSCTHISRTTWARGRRGVPYAAARYMAAMPSRIAMAAHGSAATRSATAVRGAHVCCTVLCCVAATVAQVTSLTALPSMLDERSNDAESRHDDSRLCASSNTTMLRARPRARTSRQRRRRHSINGLLPPVFEEVRRGLGLSAPHVRVDHVVVPSMQRMPVSGGVLRSAPSRHRALGASGSAQRYACAPLNKSAKGQPKKATPAAHAA